MHGAGPGSLRIPSFVDDVISAMKQMGSSLPRSILIEIEGYSQLSLNSQTCRLKESSEKMETFED